MGLVRDKYSYHGVMGYYGFLKVIKDNAMKVQLTDAYKQRLRQFFVDAMLYPAIDLELLNHGNGAGTHKIVDAVIRELRGRGFNTDLCDLLRVDL